MSSSATEIDPTEVQVGTPNGPGIYIAPAGTEPPDDTTEDWPSPWRILGYLSEDGPTVGQAQDTADVVPWQSPVPIKTVVTSRSITLQFALLQLNALTLSVYFDSEEPTVGSDGEIDMEIRSDNPQRLHAIGIDSRDGDRVFRISFSRSSLSAAGDMQISRGAAVPLDCTLAALDDAGLLARVQLGPAEEAGNGARSASSKAA